MLITTIVSLQYNSGRKNGIKAESGDLPKIAISTNLNKMIDEMNEGPRLERSKDGTSLGSGSTGWAKFWHVEYKPRALACLGSKAQGLAEIFRLDQC